MNALAAQGSRPKQPGSSPNEGHSLTLPCLLLVLPPHIEMFLLSFHKEFLFQVSTLASVHQPVFSGLLNLGDVLSVFLSEPWNSTCHV